MATVLQDSDTGFVAAGSVKGLEEDAWSRQGQKTTQVISQTLPALEAQCTKNPIYVFTEMKLSGIIPISYIHVSVSSLYIPWSVCLFGYSKISRSILWWIYKFLIYIYKCGNWETEHFNSFLEITRPRSFISENTWIGTSHLYWILTGSSLQCVPVFSVSKLTLSSTMGRFELILRHNLELCYPNS